MEARALKRGRGSAPACYLEWYPYTKDRTMGLNHQMASLSCALGEAFRLGRTLLLPAQICLFALHTERWSDGGGPGERCVPITDLFDLDRLSHLVPVRIGSNDTTRLFRPAHTARVGAGWSSQRVATEHPCVAGGARLVRRHVDTFWFQQCARRHTDYNSLAAKLNMLVGAAANAPKPLNIILRSGLYFSPAVKAAAAAIRAAIGGPYASLHVRRSDKLTAKSHEAIVGGQKVTVPAACNPEDCKTRDLLTRPPAIEKSLLMWLPPGSHVYIGSTEPVSTLIARHVPTHAPCAMRGALTAMEPRARSPPSSSRYVAPSGCTLPRISGQSSQASPTTTPFTPSRLCSSSARRRLSSRSRSRAVGLSMRVSLAPACAPFTVRS